MEDNLKNIQKEKNSGLSVILIMVNIVLSIILANVNSSIDNGAELTFIVMVFSATILIGGYAFTYHGKSYRIAKWIFGILFLISMLLIGLLWYAAALGHAFQH